MPVAIDGKRHMKANCSACTFLMNLSGLIPEEKFPDGNSLRCGKESRYVAGFPPAITDPLTESCDQFIEYDPHRPRWEWDENKNKKNIEKHGVSFEDAVAALDADKNSFRYVAKSWDDLTDFDFDGNGVIRTFANTDPVRDVYLFTYNEKVWALVSTLRGEFGKIKQRVISARRASLEEQTMYDLRKKL